MSSSRIYNRIDLNDGLMVTIQHASASRKQGFLLILTDLDSRMECGRKFFLAFADARAYAESCFNKEETQLAVNEAENSGSSVAMSIDKKEGN